jgi:ubiquinol-cytochrome c reductase cytochrome c subunit
VPASRTRRTRRGVLVLSAACAAFALCALAAPAAAETAGGDGVELGRELFVEGCSSCHGVDARGRPGQGPSLVGVGAGSADFYLSTGRMPLDDPTSEPARTRPAYSRSDRDALVAYIGSLGGPPVPAVDPAQGELNEGFKEFSSNCAGCHQIAARGGVVPGAPAPALQDATPTQIAEAVRTGPYLMPRFRESQIDDHQLNSIARYILSTRDPDDRGGWAIGHIGPIPEGMVAWLLAGVVLLFVARLIGERTR